MENTIDFTELNIQPTIKTLPSGLKCYIIPMKGYVEKQAVFCSRYGSIDNRFETNGKIHDMPIGIAHFLEHKMFEDKEISVFEEFSKLGANVNAFTNFTATAYYFNCIDNFDKNFQLLLDFVSSPYFTDKNVEKEKGIIEQEISMYDDDPNWVVYFNMLRGLYNSHPVKENIAGSAESIAKITKEMLTICYDTFYTPKNMGIICVGDFDENNIFDIVNKSIKSEKSADLKRFYEDENKKVAKPLIEAEMHVARPLFSIGYKDNSTETPDQIVATKILLDIIAGESSQWFIDLYEKGLIDENFSFDYTSGKGFGYSSLCGISSEPENVFYLLEKEIDKIRKNGININRFEQIKNKRLGRFVRGFNFIDALASSSVDYFARDTNLFDVFSSYHSITLDDVENRLKTHLDANFAVLSIVK